MNKQNNKINFSFPILVSRESKWFVAECPMLGLASQGKTDKEVKENIKDLIQEYLGNPDTSKRPLREMDSVSFGYVSVPVASGLLYEKA